MNKPNKGKKGMEVLNGVPREDANVEVEKDEVVVGTDPSTNHKITALVGGKKHSQGGTPENLPEGSAVYSDNLKLSDPTLLQILGFNGKKPKTFADIAKKWDTAELIKKKEDPTNDKISNTSLDKSLEDANFKLSLAFTLQQFHEKKKGSQEEHSKHFEPLMERTGLSYDQLLGSAEESNLADNPENPPLKRGGQVKFDSIPMYLDGNETDDEKNKPGPTKDDPTGDKVPINVYSHASKDGRYTPTGKLNYYEAREEDLPTYSNKWKSVLGADISALSEKDAQSRIYDWSLKNNPDAIKNMWLTYGLTAKGLNNPELAKLTKQGRFTRAQLNDPKVLEQLKDAFVDGYFGVRQLDPNAPELSDKTVVKTIKPDPRKLDDPYKWNVQNMPEGQEAPEDMRYRWENKRALSQAVKQKANIPYLRPLSAVSDTFYTDQAYYNPDQAIAAIQSASATQGQQRGMFAAPQQQLANQVAGEQFQLLANVIGQYADKNVNAYSSERLVNTQIANISADKLARAIEGHHSKVTTLKQNFANAYQAADNQIAEQEIAMHQERAKRRNLEMSIGEQYRIDPNTGLRVFVKGKDFSPDTTETKTVDDRYAELKRKHPSMSDDAAVKLAMAEFSGKYQVQSTDEEYNPNNYRD